MIEPWRRDRPKRLNPRGLKNKGQNNGTIWVGTMRVSIFCPLTHNLLEVDGVTFE
jgi:hypothetical protein